MKGEHPVYGWCEGTEGFEEYCDVPMYSRYNSKHDFNKMKGFIDLLEINGLASTWITFIWIDSKSSQVEIHLNPWTDKDIYPGKKIIELANQMPWQGWLWPFYERIDGDFDCYIDDSVEHSGEYSADDLAKINHELKKDGFAV